MDATQTTSATPISEAALWDAYGRRIYRYLYQLLGQRETAEDLSQETFLRAIRALRRAPKHLDDDAAWIFRIATNLFRDHIRRRRLIGWLPFLPHKHEASVADEADRLAQQDLVTQVLRRLPPETAALLLLKDGEGLVTREVAAALGLDYDVARKRLARARLKFREEYHRLGGDTE